MEFNFNCEELLSSDKEGFAILTTDEPKSINAKQNINQILDIMGTASAKAQGLKAIITTPVKFYSSNHRAYFKVEKNLIIGFLKVGTKKLFIRNDYGKINEIEPLCVLDFYVHESQQRFGHGKSLFEKMLSFEKIKPLKLGYDRPSEKLIKFLSKHYNLNRYVPQNNNFVVFSSYFEDNINYGVAEIKSNQIRSKSRSSVRTYGQNIINNDNFFLGGGGGSNNYHNNTVKYDNKSTNFNTNFNGCNIPNVSKIANTKNIISNNENNEAVYKSV